MRRLWHREPELATAIGASSLVLVLLLSSIVYAGGDWCWGPRYLVPLLPLWGLGLPFLTGAKMRRELVVAVIAVGFMVQILGLSVENQRFFMERGLHPHFWEEDHWVYFKQSALIARVGEVVSLNEGVPPTAQLFSPVPIAVWSTYAMFPPPQDMPRQFAPQWVRSFKIFFLPRPWPLWMSWLPRSERPINMRSWLLGVLSMLLAGFGMMYRGLRKEERQSSQFGTGDY